MNEMVQWVALLSPIIAVLLAWWTVRSSSKDTAKQIAAIEENTSKQIDNLKDLTRLQMDASIKQVELEIEKYRFYARQAKNEMDGIRRINHSGMAYYVDWKESAMKDFCETKPERDYELYSQHIHYLEAMKQELISNRKNMD